MVRVHLNKRLQFVGPIQTVSHASLDAFEGKTTLPYIDLYEALNNEGQEKLVSLHGKVLNDDEKWWIKESMENYGVIQKSYDYAQMLCDDAISSVSSEDALRAIVTSVMLRNH